MRQALLVCVATLGMATSANADSLSVNVLNTSYSVTLTPRTFTDGVATQQTRTTTGAAPVSDGFLLTGTYDIQGGMASADLFDVSTWTNAEDAITGTEGTLAGIAAYATTTVTFMPVATTAASIDVTFLLAGDARAYSESSVKLVDLTTSMVVWTLGWEYRDLLAALPLISAPTTMTSQFDDTHLYQLTLFAHTSAREDSQTLTTSVGGLQNVPEPSTLSLLAIGVTCMVKRRWSSRNAPR